ncbi:hypothetical protein pdam_00012614, partial [Pocillopora damicornis]
MDNVRLWILSMVSLRYAANFEIPPAVEQDHQVVISEHESGSVLDINENKQRERPKRTTKTSQSVVTEEFTKRVEEVIKKTQPGSEEEIFLVFSKSSRIQCSHSKTT